jgi:hypothetical protein
VNIKETILDGELRLIPVLLDAFGLWSVSNEEVFKDDVDKQFIGVLCIARNIIVIKAVEEELLQTQHRLMEMQVLPIDDSLMGTRGRNGELPEG